MEIPIYIQNIIKKLEKAGFEAFIVGGCVRDLLMGCDPKDWDITTNARPEQILKVFPEGKYENKFGTVLVPLRQEGDEKENVEVVEITTYRSEHGYSDRRHPDEVIFEDNLEKDLSRRDFTINAMAAGHITHNIEHITKESKQNLLGDTCYVLVDLFGGEKDLQKRIIRAVGEPIDRFKEDALRMMRAIRFSSQLGFSIEPKTERGIINLAGSIKFIANERIRDELVKILKSDRAYEGIMYLHNTKLLQYILPELERGAEQKQARHHIYNVFEHSVLSLKYCPNKDWRVRFAALLHDVAKPQTAKIIDGITTFYNHEYLGAKMVLKIMQRLHFSNQDAEKISVLIRNHMFYYNVDEVTASSVRRLIVKVGKENLQDLIDLRVADRLGSGVPKAKPYKLRHLEYMMEKVQNDPVSVKMLKVNGEDIMKTLKIAPGPKIGAILDVLLSEVIEDPELNNKKYLNQRMKELSELNLTELRAKAKNVIEEKREAEDKKIKEEYWVK
ncbi:MAG: CCA tRNA nucleotidyltransferase [Patescibacteria group bacterium]|nr:CCA tRNA nucleotidyltransferase [Patescibacteria group bacterium]MDD4611367.1 CCA tRNA nucleotidyltransferase [Patescibacteria group bacterium]